MGHRLGVDVGGTFTDVQMQDTDTGDVTLVKVLSTPSDQSVGVLAGVREACRRTGASPKDLELILHGSTVVTNLILESKGAACGLLTARPFADGFISYQDDRAQTFPWGLQGGRHGAPSQKTLIRGADGSEKRLPSKVENVPVHRGYRLVFCTAGAGGLGDPLTREPERVATDVKEGLVSVQAAREHYGVAVSARGEIDTAATEQARDEARDGVDRSDEFDFGPVPVKEQLTERIADERREFDAWMAAESRA